MSLQSNIEYAANFWESDSFKDWADEEVMEHGDVSFDEWADQELSESSHQTSDKLTFEDWVGHENAEMTHGAESFESDYEVCICDSPAPRHAGVHPQSCLSCNMIIDAETFELHDWYDDMSDYGGMEMHPRIQEQKDEYLQNLDEQRDSYERSKRTNTQENLVQKRMRNINRAVRESRNNEVRSSTGRLTGPILAGDSKSWPQVKITNLVKYVGVLAALGFVGYKVTSNN